MRGWGWGSKPVQELSLIMSEDLFFFLFFSQEKDNCMGLYTNSMVQRTYKATGVSRREV